MLPVKPYCRNYSLDSRLIHFLSSMNDIVRNVSVFLDITWNTVVTGFVVVWYKYYLNCILLFSTEQKVIHVCSVTWENEIFISRWTVPLNAKTLTWLVVLYVSKEYFRSEWAVLRKNKLQCFTVYGRYLPSISRCRTTGVYCRNSRIYLAKKVIEAHFVLL